MRKIGNFLGEKNGVSPVIGVVLMVAITVILAAVAGLVVFGLDGNQNASPSVAMETSAQGQTVEFSVSGGDKFDPSTATLKVDVTVKNPESGNSKTTSLSTALDKDASKTVTVNGENVNVEFDSLDSDDVTAGDSFSVTLDSSQSSSNLAIANYDAKVVRQAEGGSSSSVLFSDKGSASASSGSSSADLSSKITRSNIASTQNEYELNFTTTENNAFDSTNYDFVATFTVNNTSAGGSKKDFTYDESDMGLSDMSSSGVVSGTYSEDELEPRVGFYSSINSGDTFDSGDKFAFKLEELANEHTVEGFRIKIIEESSGDTVYTNSQ